MLEDADLKLVYKWFTHFDGTQINDPEIGKRMLDVRVAIGVGAYEQVKPLNAEITKLINNPEQARETTLFIALITLDTKDSDTQKFFVARDLVELVADYYYESTASSNDRYFHYLSVFAWLRGYISWKIGEYLQPKQTDPHYPFKRLNQYRMDAIEAWTFCVRVLNELCYSFLIKEPGWYQEIRWRVTDSMYETRRRDNYYAISKVYHWYPQVAPVAEKTQTPQPEKRSAKKPQRRVIYNIPVYQYVPAGGWGVVGSDAVAYVDIELEDIIIENVHYQAIDLRGKGRVTLREGIDYAIIKVLGTSMNLLNILDGDYVLIERQQNAEHMDIVLAALQDIDTKATLKKLFKQKTKIELHPVSTDPENQILTLEKPEKLNILGIAIAVFKPSEGSDSNELESIKIEVQELQGSLTSRDLFGKLLHIISVFDRLYTQLTLISLFEIKIALEYTEGLLRFLGHKGSKNNFQDINLEKRYLEIFDFNQKLLEKIGGVPLRILSIEYGSPLSAILDVAKIVAPSLFGFIQSQQEFANKKALKGVNQHKSVYELANSNLEFQQKMNSTAREYLQTIEQIHKMSISDDEKEQLTQEILRNVHVLFTEGVAVYPIVQK